MQIVAVAVSVVTAAQNTVYGDVTGDSNVDVSDVIKLLQLLASDGIAEFNQAQKIAIDVNCDGNVDVSDAIRTLQHLANPESIVLGPQVSTNKLTAPIIRNVEYDIIYWDEVPNASYYTVVINTEKSGNYRCATDVLYTHISEAMKQKADGTYASITEAGVITISVFANGDGEKHLDSDKSNTYTCTYVPEKEIITNDIVSPNAQSLGYGYNAISGHMSINEATEEILNFKKLLTIGEYRVDSATDYQDVKTYNYSSVNEMMSKHEEEFSTNFELGVPSVGSIKSKFKASIGINHNEYKYNETFLVDGIVGYQVYTIKGYDDRLLKHCLSEQFLKDVKRQSTKTAGLTKDADLARYIYETYGTHVVLGVKTGGNYLAKYTISTNNESVAKSVKSNFETSGSIDAVVKVGLDMGLESNSETSWSNSETRANFDLTWSGTTAGATTSPEGMNSAMGKWSEALANDDTPVWIEFSKDGLIPLYEILGDIDTDVAKEFVKLFADNAGIAYEELYKEYIESCNFPMQVYYDNDNGNNVLEIDLSNYQNNGTISAYDPNFLEGVLTVYPSMYGRYIDKILVKGALAETTDPTLINNFTLALSGTWHRDVEIVFENLGVVCASETGIVDISKVKGNAIIIVEYSGMNVIQETDGTYLIRGKYNNKEFDYSVILQDGESIVLDTARTDNGQIYLPIAEISGGDFGGWRDGPNDTDTLVAEADGLLDTNYIPDVEITPLTPIRNPHTYTITLDNNGADKSDGTSVIKQIYGERFTDSEGYILKESENKVPIDIPKKTGYIFDGYFYGNTEIINAKGEITASTTVFNGENRNVTLIAQWDPAIYTIILNNNGATVAGTAEFYLKYGEGYYFNPECTNDASITKITPPKKDNHSFVGYLFNSDEPIIPSTEIPDYLKTMFNEDNVTADESKKTNGYVTFTAKWSENIRIQLNADEADNKDRTKTIYMIPDGTGFYFDANCTELITSDTPIAKPARTGYTFVGYYDEVSNNSTVNSVGSTQYITNEGYIIQSLADTNLTELVAMWTPHRPIIMFDYNGGHPPFGNSTTVETEQVYGKSYTLPLASRTGYTFTGWFTEKTGGTKIDSNTIVNVTDDPDKNIDQILYAHWVPNKYTVSYDLNCGGLLADPINDITYTGNNAQISYSFPTNTYTFTNTSSADPHVSLHNTVYLKAGTTYYVHMYIPDSNENAVQMFYAINGAFEEAKSIRFGGDIKTTKTITVAESGAYKIRIDNDTDKTIKIKDFWITEADTRPIENAYDTPYNKLPTPTREGYTFIGWYLNGMKIEDDTKLTYFNHTLTARWIKQEQYSDYTYLDHSTGLSPINNDLSGKYLLISDINLDASSWNPLGVFKGVLDGNKKTISNLKCSPKLTEKSYFGLFSQLEGATISDINFSNVSIAASYTTGNNSARQYVATLAGYAKNSTITNVSVSGNITLNYNTSAAIGGEARVAGIVAEANGGCSFVNCTNSAKIYNRLGTSCTGGIVGTSYGNKFTDCHNSGEISSDACVIGGTANSGGIVGNCKNGTSFNGCSNVGKISSVGALFHTGNTGSIVGKSEN